jgi:hypothetical protein
VHSRTHTEAKQLNEPTSEEIAHGNTFVIGSLETETAWVVFQTLTGVKSNTLAMDGGKKKVIMTNENLRCGMAQDRKGT